MNRLNALFNSLITRYHRGSYIPRHAVQMVMNYASRVVCSCGRDCYNCPMCDTTYNTCGHHKSHLFQQCGRCKRHVCAMCVDKPEVYQRSTSTTNAIGPIWLCKECIDTTRCWTCKTHIPWHAKSSLVCGKDQRVVCENCRNGHLDSMFKNSVHVHTTYRCFCEMATAQYDNATRIQNRLVEPPHKRARKEKPKQHTLNRYYPGG